MTACAYCGSTSPNDSRGNCAACGGPRQGVATVRWPQTKWTQDMIDDTEVVRDTYANHIKLLIQNINDAQRTIGEPLLDVCRAIAGSW